MRNLKKSISILLVVALAFGLSGCWNRRELNSLGIVMGVAIDKTKKEGIIELSAQIVDTSKMQSGSVGGSGISYITISGEGHNPISIMRGFTHQISRKLYMPHNQMIVFGQALAKEGIHDALDFYLRDHETRLTVNVFVAKDKGKDVFDVEPELAKIPAADISLRIQAQSATSETATLTIFELMNCLASKTHSAVAPLVEVMEVDGKRKASISGGAVFKGDKVVGELDKMQTRGLLWVTDKVKSGIMELKIEDEQVNIEIVKAVSKATPEIKSNGEIHYKIKIKQSGIISSQTGSKNLTEPDNVKLLEKAAQDEIKKEIEAAFEQGKKLNADIFGIGDSIHLKYHDKWGTLQDNWDAELKKVILDIETESKIFAEGRLAKPDYPAKE